MSGLHSSDPMEVARAAEQDLNSHENKAGHVGLDRSNRHGKPVASSADESGVNDGVENKFPGASVSYGSAASGAGDNREIPDSEGGGINPQTGRQTKAGDFEGVGGPEDKLAAAQLERGGDDDVVGNTRQGGETRRP